jgi:hypothetical protein
MNEYLPALQIVGATVKVHVDKLKVPPQVLLPTPPTTTAPRDKHPLTALVALLQIPEPTNPYSADTEFFCPPTIVAFATLAVLPYPPDIVEKLPVALLRFPPLITELLPEATLLIPPVIVEPIPVAQLSAPARAAEQAAVAVLDTPHL